MNLDHEDVAVFTLLILVSSIVTVVEHLATTSDEVASMIDFFLVFGVGWAGYRIGIQKAP